MLKYLKSISSFGIHFTPSEHTTLTCYTNADWANFPNDRCSTSGFCVFLGNNVVFWSSSKQKVVPHSNAESEYRGMSNVAAELIWTQSLLREIGFPLITAPLLLCDNVSATYLVANPVLHQRTKHIEIDLHFIQERVLHKQLLVRFVPSEDQLADILTKPLPSTRFSLSSVQAHCVTPCFA